MPIDSVGPSGFPPASDDAVRIANAALFQAQLATDSVAQQVKELQERPTRTPELLKEAEDPFGIDARNQQSGVQAQQEGEGVGKSGGSDTQGRGANVDIEA